MTLDVGLDEVAWQGVDAGAQGLVDRWLVAPGAHVAAGEVLAIVVLVKTTLEVRAPAAGVVQQILVRAGDNFARGQALARMSPG